MNMILMFGASLMIGVLIGRQCYVTMALLSQSALVQKRAQNG